MIPVVFRAGKVITIVMMKTTIADVNGMEETVVVVMLTQLTVQLVNVLILMLDALVAVVPLLIKVINIVMIITTIVDVNGMQEIVVVMMLSQITVQLVNVLILMLANHHFLITEERKMQENIISLNTQAIQVKTTGCQD